MHTVIVAHKPISVPPWTLHPVLFAWYPVLFLWGINVNIVPWQEGLRLCVATTVVALVVQAICTTMMRDGAAGAALASLVVMIILTYGRVYAAVLGVTISGMRVGRHLVLLTVIVVAVVAAARYLRRPRKSLAMATSALNVMAIALVALAAGPLLPQVFEHGKSTASDRREARSDAVASQVRPDIYYIIADGYGAASVLKSLYGFSNEPFVQALRDRDFFVAEESNSNYVTTVLSLTSSLNMDYVVPPLSRFAPSAPTAPDREQQFQSATVSQFLRRRGYVVLNIKPMDRFSGEKQWLMGQSLPTLKWNSLFTELLRSSILTELTTLLVPRDIRHNFLGTVDELVAVRDRPGPKFVFAHLLPPHPPFVFTSTGGLVDPPSESWSDRASYVQQLQFVNETLLAVVDTLLAGPGVDPIIIIQGDHGPASEGGSWAEPSLALIRERLPILNAYHVAGGRCPFYQSVTPVNSFRIIFNCRFNAHFTLLPDSSFFSSYDRQYQFRNVTALVGDKSSKKGRDDSDSASSMPRREGSCMMNGLASGGCLRSTNTILP